MKKIILIMGLGITSMLADNVDLDSFFGNDLEVTDVIIEKMKLEQELSLEKIEKIRKNTKVVFKENQPPKVYFKQPRIYTIYTREELRSYGNIDMILNSGWKTIIVGNHQLIINNEIKIK